MKKLTLLVPSYKGSLHIKRNISFWMEVSKLADIVFIEDHLQTDFAGMLSGVDHTIFQKSNGNWGSVINYAIKNKVIKTEYMCVFDVDDIANINEIKKLINEMVDDDVYMTKYEERDWNTERTKGVLANTFVHNIWIKTEVFNRIPKLPENVFFTDQNFLAAISSLTSKVKKLNLIPYIYYTGVDGQSIDQNDRSLIDKKSSYLEGTKIRGWVDRNGLTFKNKTIFSMSKLRKIEKYYNRAMKRIEGIEYE